MSREGLRRSGRITSRTDWAKKRKTSDSDSDSFSALPRIKSSIDHCDESSRFEFDIKVGFEVGGLSGSRQEPQASDLGQDTSVDGWLHKRDVMEKVAAKERAMLEDAEKRTRDKKHTSFPVNYSTMKYSIEGINSHLTALQFATVGWMLKQENSPKWRGGLIAHDMGIGKTLIVLACTLINKFSPKTKGPPLSKGINEVRCATLIVVPNQSAAEIWISEVKKHFPETSELQDIIQFKMSESKTYNGELRGAEDLQRYTIV
jgi:SNF2 family DNA or RNA helicase